MNEKIELLIKTLEEREKEAKEAHEAWGKDAEYHEGRHEAYGCAVALARKILKEQP